MDSLAVVAHLWTNLHITLALQLNLGLLDPPSMQLLQILTSGIRRIISSGILQRREFFISQSLKQADFISLLEDIEIEQLKFDAIILLDSYGFLLKGIPILDFLLGQVISIIDILGTFC